jgi:predicted RNase H-like HicB family nuclease
MTHYVGVLDGSDDVWGVRVPDLPGCHGGGYTPDAAIADAVSSMREWAETMLSRGASLPRARSVADLLKADEIDVGAGESAVMVPLVIDSGRSVRANLSLDAGLLAAIDAESTRRGLTRSAFIASAARDKIEGQR